MPHHFSSHAWRNLRIEYEKQSGIAWYYMQPQDRLSFTHDLLHEIKLFQEMVKQLAEENRRFTKTLYTVLASDAPGVFNFGGDLALFSKCILNRDRKGLERYAEACIDVLYNNAVNLESPVTTISLVQGQALGGGFEAALSSEVVIAERGVRLGFPEIMFNLFPGMGAFHLLSERVSHVMAKRMIQGGNLYTAEDLYDIGLIDILAEPGEGEQAVMEYIRRHRRSWNGYMHIQKVAAFERAFNYQDLMNAANIWVDAAMQISAKDVRKMEKLVSAQRKVFNNRNDDDSRSVAGSM